MFEAGIVAPLGPVRVEALTLTLVRPPEGACKTTWLSTVSPRALEREMEEFEPRVSVFPTRSRPVTTQVGNAFEKDMSFDGVAFPENRETKVLRVTSAVST